MTPGFIDVMYEESQGISDIAIKLFMLTQWRALDKEIEHITTEMIRSVARDRFTLIKPALEALRSGKKSRIQKFADIYDSVSIDDYLDRIEAEKRKSERLEIIKTELGYDLKEQTITEVNGWLIEAGIEESIAFKAAKAVVQEHLHEIDVIDLHKEALKLTLQEQNYVVSTHKPTQRIKSKAKSLPTEPNDLRVIVTQGKKKKLAAYDSLKVAGYIKDPMEFISYKVVN